MTREDAVKHLENMKWLLGVNNTTVNDVPLTKVIDDIVALLKAQEPIAPIQGADDQEEDIFCCGSCGAVVGETFLGPPGECEVRDNYCPNCGARMDGDANG